MSFAVVWGELVGEGIYDARFCTLQGVVKSEVEPLETCLAANEYICNRLALALGLPAPPGGLIYEDHNRPAFVSLRFGSLKESPPAVIPEEFATDLPSLAAGVVVFDCWVNNPDRHALNLAYRRGVIPPAIFDHGLCLGGEIRSRIRGLSEDIEIETLPTCLSPWIKSDYFLSRWRESVGSLPPLTISSILDEVVVAGLLTESEATQIRAFLLGRRLKLLDLLKQMMPHVPDWGMV